MRHLLVLLLCVLAATADASAADTPTSLVVRGTIARIDGRSVTIVAPDGATVTAALGPSTTFGTVEPRRFQQVSASDFVGITSVPGPRDTLSAKEIHIFPAKLWEGSYPWNHAPGGAKARAAGTSTNGTVAAVEDDPSAYTMTNASVTASSVGKLSVSYRGAKIVDGKCTGRASDAAGEPCQGVSIVNVPPAIPIVAIVPAKLADAKVGLAVFAVVVRQGKGDWVALTLTLEKNGVKPVF